MRLLSALLISATLMPSAQTASDTSAYTVAYVDVMPAAKATAVAAFKQYRETSRKETGFVRFELFEQAGRPGHLAIIETWSNPKALDGHAMAASVKEWRSKLDMIRLSDYDQRPYKTLTLGAAPAT